MRRLSFTEHPASVGETYWEHLHSAWSFSTSMIAGGLACFVHAIFPFMFVSAGSSTIRKLYDCMVINRTRTMVNESQEPRSLSAQAASASKVAVEPTSTRKRPAND